MPNLDTPFVRGLFPTFATEQTAENAYFTHAGGTFACLPVQGRMIRFFRTRLGEPGNPFAPSGDAAQEMHEARSRLAAMMGVDTGEVHFGPSTAMNTYVLAQAFGDWLKPGDAVVVTEQDHEAVSGVWRGLARRGIEVRDWRADPLTGTLDIGDLANLLDDRVRLVCVPHVSNVLGEVNPVTEICAMARAAGAFSIVDGAAYAAQGLPDVGAMGADVYMISAHKCYGPHQGIMVVRNGLTDYVPGQGAHFRERDIGLRALLGDADCAQIASCAGIAEYFEALHDHHFPAMPTDTQRDRAERVAGLIGATGRRLAAPVIEYLGGRNSVRVLGPAEIARRTSTVSAVFRRPANEVQAALAERGVMTSAGHFGSPRILAAMGLDPDAGVLRISPMHYSSTYEVNRLIDAIDRVI